ncbi:unnamed protein product [Meloidogyne enterolobii]|uniref:Uncharacterized protein n=1 Tax=Meloidogyne enterolobii TaxID=390850 RepID=A0ACB1ACZ3_MELEN
MFPSIGIAKKKNPAEKECSLRVIDFKLFPSTSRNYPRFDFEQVCRELNFDSKQTDVNNCDGFHDRDAEEIVRRLEAKYGTGTLNFSSPTTGSKKLKKNKKPLKFVPEDVMDKGLGYVQEDDFIDDTEAYDEWVPTTMDTLKHGHYVNKGPLEFRQLDIETSTSESTSSESESSSSSDDDDIEICERTNGELQKTDSKEKHSNSTCDKEKEISTNRQLENVANNSTLDKLKEKEDSTTILMFNDDDFPVLASSMGHGSQQPQKSTSLVNDDLKEKRPNVTEIAPENVGIRTHPDGRVTNIPPGMLNDQFGMAGLLTFLRTIESSPSIVGLALGHDLTNLGLNLNSSKRNLFQTFGGPWADFPCRIQDLDAKVPEEYLTNATIRDKLPNIKLNKLHEDVLFYLFYNCPGEVYQVAAASELYARDWRFHKIERFWLQRAAFSAPPREIGGTYERCQYNAFDPIQWRRV